MKEREDEPSQPNLRKGEEKKSSVETWTEKPRKVKSITRDNLTLEEKPKRKANLCREMGKKASET